MPGQLGGAAGAADLAHRLGVRRVQPHALTREQVVVDRLAEEGVPEGVLGLPGADEHVRVDGLAQRGLELVLVDGRDPAEQLVGDPLPGGRGDPHDVARVLVEPVEPHQQEVGEVLGQAPAAAEERGDELLDVERIALRALDDPGDVVVVLRVDGRGADQVDDHGPHRARWERLELDPLDPVDADPLGHPLAQGVPAVHLVGAVGDHGQEPAAEPAREQEADQVAGARVGPVGVLEHHHHRGPRAELVEQPVERLEDLDPVQGLGRVARAGPAPQPRQRRVAGGQLLGELGPALLDLAEHLGEGQVGHARLAEVEAVADQAGPAVRGQSLESLGQQPGLADSGVTGEQHHPGTGWPAEGLGPDGPGCGGAEQGRELGLAADDALGPAPLHPHIGHHRVRRPVVPASPVDRSRRHQRRAPLLLRPAWSSRRSSAAC